MLDLTEIKAALKAATPGPWAVYETPVSVHGGIGRPDCDEAVLEDRHLASSDANLIANAPTWLVALVARVESDAAILDTAKSYNGGLAVEISHAMKRVKELEAWQREALPILQGIRSGDLITAQCLLDQVQGQEVK